CFFLGNYVARIPLRRQPHSKTWSRTRFAGHRENGAPCYTGVHMLRVRFAPSPTGFLHIGSARTFIFNWLYARRHGGVMILRIDDTDVERNTQASLDSIFEGLNWLDMGWDEQYRQSERLALHKEVAESILRRGLAYRDFT